MKVIFLKDVPKVGRKNEVKDISDGYAQNFLIPRGLAVRATSSSLDKLEKEKKEHQIMIEVNHELLKKEIETLSKEVISINAKANDLGHLFAGINAKDLASIIEKQTRIKINQNYIVLDKPIREIGEVLVDIKAEGVKGRVKVVITKE